MVKRDPIPEKEEITKVFHYELLEELSNKVPENVWSTHKDEITNEHSTVNLYLTEFTHHLHEGDEAITFKFFQAAIATYNTGQLLNVLDKDDLLFQVFDQAVRQQNT